MSLPVLVLTSDVHAWLVPAVLHQLNKHWQPRPRVIVAGYSPIPNLPPWAEFFKIGEFVDYPVGKWSDGARIAVNSMPERFILLLDDYLILRRVDTAAIEIIEDWLTGRDDIFRFDLSTDRLYAPGAKHAGYIGRLDLLETAHDVPYQVSAQPGIFDREKLLEVMVKSESPWDFEIMGSYRMQEYREWRVLGTRQAPVRCKIAVNKGKLDLETLWQYPAAILAPEDVDELKAKGLIP